MNTEGLNKSPLRNKYFARTKKWDWLNSEMIHVYDSKSTRMITMDQWPQTVYLDAIRDKTVEEYVHFFAKRYPKNQIPEELPNAILESLNGLVDQEGIVELSDLPITLSDELLVPLTTEGVVDLIGTWKGLYTYNIPDEFKDEKMQQVEFTIKIEKVEGKKFWGTVEDNNKRVELRV